MAFQNIFVVVFNPQKIHVASLHVWALNYANMFNFHLFRSLAPTNVILTSYPIFL